MEDDNGKGGKIDNDDCGNDDKDDDGTSGDDNDDDDEVEDEEEEEEEDDDDDENEEEEEDYDDDIGNENENETESLCRLGDLLFFTHFQTRINTRTDRYRSSTSVYGCTSNPYRETVQRTGIHFSTEGSFRGSIE